MQRSNSKSVWLILQIITGVLLLGYAAFLVYLTFIGPIWPRLFFIEVALILLYGLFRMLNKRSKVRTPAGS